MAKKRRILGSLRLSREDFKKAAFSAAQGCVNLENSSEVDRRSCQAGVLEMVRALKETNGTLSGKKRRR